MEFWQWSMHAHNFKRKLLYYPNMIQYHMGSKPPRSVGTYSLLCLGKSCVRCHQVKFLNQHETLPSK
eukprot:3527421-Amphidinium_carterae.1